MAIYTRADHLASVGTGFEPQRQHNWAVEFNLSPDADEVIKLSLVAGFLPSGFNEVVPISFGNETVYVAGKADWEQGQVICRDWVDRATAQALLEWRAQVYNQFYGSIGLATNYKRNSSILVFPPNARDGFEPDAGVRVWTLQGCWPVRVNPAQNGLDMTSSGQVQLEVQIRYDKAFANYVQYASIIN
jgi:hypothetical protein